MKLEKNKVQDLYMLIWFDLKSRVSVHQDVAENFSIKYSY